MSKGNPPDAVQKLTDEMERARDKLGETVEALAARVDVKTRAREVAAEVTGRLAGTADQVKEQAAARSAQVQSEVADKAGDLKQTILASGEQVRQQVTDRATQAGSSAWDATPEPVQQAAKRAIDSAQQRRMPLAVVAGIAVACWMIIRWRRR